MGERILLLLTLNTVKKSCANFIETCKMNKVLRVCLHILTSPHSLLSFSSRMDSKLLEINLLPRLTLTRLATWRNFRLKIDTLLSILIGFILIGFAQLHAFSIMTIFSAVFRLFKLYIIYM